MNTQQYEMLCQTLAEIDEETENQDPCQFDDETGDSQKLSDEMPEMYAIFEDR